MNRNRRDLTRRFLPKFFLLPYGTLPKPGGCFLYGSSPSAPTLISKKKSPLPERCFFSLARHKGLTQPLRVCRPSAPFHSASDTLPLEGPQDLLPFAAALSGSSPSAPTLISKKKSPLSERCFFFGAPQGTRTPNLRIRSARLYPIELVALIGRFSRPVLENYTLLHHPVSKYISSHHHISLIIIHHYHKS